MTTGTSTISFSLSRWRREGSSYSPAATEAKPKVWRRSALQWMSCCEPINAYSCRPVLSHQEASEISWDLFIPGANVLTHGRNAKRRSSLLKHYGELESDCSGKLGLFWKWDRFLQRAHSFDMSELLANSFAIPLHSLEQHIKGYIQPVKLLLRLLIFSLSVSLEAIHRQHCFFSWPCVSG